MNAWSRAFVIGSTPRSSARIAPTFGWTMNPASARSTSPVLFGSPGPPPSVWATATMPSIFGCPFASGCSRDASWRATLAVRDVVPRMTMVLRVPTPRPPARR